MKNNIRSDFPIFSPHKGVEPIVYLDNAATTHKPDAVLRGMVAFYSTHNANVHRSTYGFAERATTLYEEARIKVAQFIGAEDPSEIIFTRGTTEGINLVAFSWGLSQIKKGDRIVISELEHHANLLPWQWLAKETGAELVYLPITDEGALIEEQFDEIIDFKTKLVAICHVSNSLGVQNNIKKLAERAHSVGAKILIDAAQSIPHQRINVSDMKIDFLAFSGHKMLGPFGIGVLYIARDIHEKIKPYQRGGGMVYSADCYQASWRELPHRLEAGTPPIAQAIGLSHAIKYLEANIDFEVLKKHEALLCAHIIEELSRLPEVKILGPQDELKQRGHMVSFFIHGIHAHDVAAFLDSDGISVRAGNHCAQPLALRLSISSWVRVSVYLYTSREDIERFLCSLKAIVIKYRQVT